MLRGVRAEQAGDHSEKQVVLPRAVGTQKADHFAAAFDQTGPEPNAPPAAV